MIMTLAENDLFDLTFMEMCDNFDIMTFFSLSFSLSNLIFKQNLSDT